MLKKTVLFFVLTLFALQFISTDTSNPKVDETLTLKTDDTVMRLLKKSCYDCHSFETKWPYYAEIAPVSFFVSAHVNDARKALNFSLWEKMDKKIKLQRVKRAIVTINNEMMAFPRYVMAHEDAKLTRSEKEILINWFKIELHVLEQNLDINAN